MIRSGANLSSTCSKALVGLETRICAALIGSAKSHGTKIADAGVLRSRPMYFRSVKKLISPGVASLSDAAPVIFSVESPTSSPPDSAASSWRVNVIEALKRQPLGSARVPRAGFGVSPKQSFLSVSLKNQKGKKNSATAGDAVANTRDACAPQRCFAVISSGVGASR